MATLLNRTGRKVREHAVAHRGAFIHSSVNYPLQENKVVEGTSAKLEVNRYDDLLTLNAIVNNQVSLHQVKIHYERIDIRHLVLFWLLNCLKPVLFEMPFEELDISFSEQALEGFGQILGFSETVLKETNTLLTEYRDKKNIGAHYDKVLFFNVGDAHRYKSLYGKLKDADPDKVLYMNMDHGFNGLTRTREDRDVLLPLPDLVEFIEREGIRKIVSVNQYILEKYLNKTGAYLITLFKHLGIEHVIIDNDPWDLCPEGYLSKSFFNCESFDRFSNLSILNEHWDHLYSMGNVRYIAIPQQYEQDENMVDLNEDYALLVLTNSRLEIVRQIIMSVIYVLDHMNEDAVFTETQLWYLSLRHMILNVFDLDEFEKLYYNSRLHVFFYGISQLLKYEVIESLDTERNIEVFGDVGWASIFPEYYKRLLDSREIDDLFDQKGHLYVLLNSSFTYLDASGPVYDAIKRSVPFINMEHLAKTPSFEGFRSIEYGNESELNYLVENIRTVVGNERLRDSIRICRNAFTDSTNFIQSKVLSNGNSMMDGGLFHEEILGHRVLLDGMIEDYIGRNEPFLNDSFKVLFLGVRIPYNLSRSRYFHRNYVQRILELIRD